MTDQPNAGNSNTEQQSNAEVSPSPSQAQNSDHMIPKSRLDEVLAQKREYEQKLAQIESESQQRKEAELAEQNKWQELAEERAQKLAEYERYKQQAETYQQTLQATNDSRIERIPEDKRHLVPDYEDPVKLSSWLDKALPDLTTNARPTAPSADGGSGGSTQQARNSALSAGVEDAMDIASKLGYKVDRDRIAKRLNN